MSGRQTGPSDVEVAGQEAEATKENSRTLVLLQIARSPRGEVSRGEPRLAGMLLSPSGCKAVPGREASRENQEPHTSHGHTHPTSTARTRGFANLSAHSLSTHRRGQVQIDNDLRCL